MILVDFGPENRMKSGGGFDDSSQVLLKPLLPHMERLLINLIRSAPGEALQNLPCRT